MRCPNDTWMVLSRDVVHESMSFDPFGLNKKKKGLSLMNQKNIEEVNVDMADYHFNIDADVEWIRHSESVQEPEYDVNPDDLDVIDNDNFESGTDSDDDGIEKNDKVRIRAKCFGRNPVFILDGEGPSTTDVGPKKKTIKGKGPLKKGFKACGRDLLGLDGAFMKGPYPGQLLTAIGLDANNGIYPLAYAIVEKETTDSWTWFLECVGDDLGMTKDSNFTLSLEQQKGLAIAMATVVSQVST
ncbi:mutator type transposase [Tanacetum coccineum]